MAPPFVVSSVWLLAMLTAIVLVGRPGVRVSDAIELMLVFAASLLAAVWLKPELTWIGVVVGGVAVWRLLHGRSPRVDGWFGAICAALAAALFVGGAVPLALSGGVSAVLVLVAVGLARGRSEPGPSRALVLVLVAFAAPTLAVGPEVVQGWRSAELLNQTGPAAQARAIPIWAMGFAALSLLAGGLAGLWIRR